MQENVFENVVWEMSAILSRPQCVLIKSIDEWIHVSNHIPYKTIDVIMYPYHILD